MPMHIEEYVHRIGRTGRAGAAGAAVALMAPEDVRIAKPLVAVLSGAKQPVPLPLLQLAAGAAA